MFKAKKFFISQILKNIKKKQKYKKIFFYTLHNLWLKFFSKKNEFSNKIYHLNYMTCLHI